LFPVSLYQTREFFEEILTLHKKQKLFGYAYGKLVLFLALPTGVGEKNLYKSGDFPNQLQIFKIFREIDKFLLGILTM
jgi:hypothetical protein